MQLIQKPRVTIGTNIVGLTIVGSILIGLIITSIFFLGALTTPKDSKASTNTIYTSNGNGNWSSAFSSSGSGGANIYTINQGDTVVVNSNYGGIDTIYVNGVLDFKNVKKLTLSANGYVKVGGFGKVIGGNGASRFEFTGGTNISGSFNEVGPTAATSSSGAFSPSYLPVEFVFFEGKMNANILELNWTTALEEKNSHYEIEYSLDAKNFTIADKVYSQAENGNSNEITEYNHLIDMSFLTDASIFYIRLKQMDYNGNFMYSKVIRLTKEVEKKLIIGYLGNNEVKVSYHNDFDSDLTVYNLNGAIVHSSQLAGTETIKFDLPGMYIVECTNKGQTIVEKVIIR